MGRVSTADWYRSSRRSGVNKYEGRKDLIAQAARVCLERKGVAKTSIADITREVDITRELFYYYYANKDAVVKAVIDSYVSDARQLLTEAVAAGEDSPASLLLAVLHALRAWLTDEEGLRTAMMDVLRESGAWTTTLYAVAGEALEAVRNTSLLGETEACDEVSSCGRKSGLMGAMGTMLCSDTLTDEDIAQGIAPLFY